MTQSFFAIAESWIYSTLSADATINSIATGGIWSGTAPEDTQAPYITMVNKGDTIEMVVNQDIVWATMHYDVDLVVPGNDIITPDPATVRIQQLLHQGSGTTSGGKVVASTFIRAMKTPSLEAGTEFRHLTQSFELLVQQT